MKPIIQYLVGIAAIVIIIAGLKLGADIVNQILISFLLAICITPIPEWLNRKGVPKGLSITIALIVVMLGGFLVTILLANSMVSLADSFPVYQDKLTAFYKNLEEYAASNNLNLSDLISKANINPDKVLDFASKILGSLTNFLSSSFIIATMIAFIVIEMIGYTVDTRKGKRNQVSHLEWLTGIGGDLRKYVIITALKGLITAVLNFFLLLILGVDFPFLWAFFSFLMSFIPYIGFILSFLPPAVIALIMLGPWQALFVFLGFWLINLIIENVIAPIFMKESLNISLLTTFLSLLIWGWILGLPGAVLGIPLTMALTKIYKEFREHENSSPPV